MDGEGNVVIRTSCGAPAKALRTHGINGCRTGTADPAGRKKHSDHRPMAAAVLLFSVPHDCANIVSSHENA